MSAWPVFVWYLLLSTVTYAVYGFDKAAARAGGRRAPESVMHLLEVLGGWPGALVARRQFRHKTRKRSYRVVFWLCVAANVGVAWALSVA